MTDDLIKTCHWCHSLCGGTCLGVNNTDPAGRPVGPRQMKTDDPAYWMLADGHTSTPTVNDPTCYICRDPEFAAMGLPLCRPCSQCTKGAGTPLGHVPADDSVCSVCGHDEMEEYYADMERQSKETG